MVRKAVSVHVKKKLDKRPLHCQSSSVWMGAAEEEKASWCFRSRSRPGAADWQLYPAHDGRNARRTKAEMWEGGDNIGEGSDEVQVEEGSKHHIFFLPAFLFTALSPSLHPLFLMCLFTLSPCHPFTSSSLRPSQFVTFNQRTSCGLTCLIQYKHTVRIPYLCTHAHTLQALTWRTLPRV